MIAATAVALLGMATPGAPARCATVSRFDDDAGLGAVDVDGLGEIPFHCTAIADGTRTIAPGAAVVCRVGPALLGRVEAIGVVPLPPAGS